MLPNPRSARVNYRCQGFSVVELLVIMVVVGLLAGIILPSLNKARLKANAAQCVDQFRELGAVFSKYSNDTEGRVLEATPTVNENNPAWEHTLRKHAGGQGFWRCPDCQQGHHGVGYNHFLGTLGFVGAIRKPSMTIVFGDAGIVRNPLQSDPDLWIEKKTVGNRGFNSGVFSVPASRDWRTSSQRMVNRHLGRSSVIFADGHADSIPVSAVGFRHKAGDIRVLWDNQ